VQVSPGGGVRVFGITVGETSLGAAEKLLGRGEITLFKSPDGKKGIEAYFDNVNLSGLSAKMVLAMHIPEAELQGMHQRGVRASSLGSGTQKVQLSAEDLQRVRTAPVASLTYMPGIHLSSEDALKRFGMPAEKWREKESKVEHWLYPQIGLDIAFSESEKEVLQYVPPADFNRLREPLTQGERLG
jgi:hypothetical protein